MALPAGRVPEGVGTDTGGNYCTFCSARSGSYPAFNAFNKISAGCSRECFVDLSVCHNRLQFADSMAVWAYAFGMTMLILIVLEPLMFFSRKRWPRGVKGGVGFETVEDRGTIREEIPLWELSWHEASVR